MSETTRIPHLLNPYLHSIPEDSLVLLTSVLNATTNWLLLRYILSAIKPAAGPNTHRSVVLVSFLRDANFWVEGGKRIGLDLPRLTTGNEFIFIDGLSNLFTTKKASVPHTNNKSNEATSIRSDDLQSIETKVLESFQKLTQTNDGMKPLLILDGLDFLLASTQITPSEMLSTIMTWRQTAHATVLSVSADEPLIHTQQTPLEINHAAFVTSLVHQANYVISLRLLSTGVAKDVSGVLRINKGAVADELEDKLEIEEKEVLYLVNGDGSVRVFERGSG